LIKNLQEENERLKKMLASGGKVDPSLNTFGTDEALKKQLAENDKAMRDMKLSYEEKLAEAAKSQVRDLFFKILNLDMTENFVLLFKGGSERGALLQKAKTTPHLSNINMDPTLSGSIKLLLEGDGVKKIGMPGKSDIPLNGLG